MGGRGGSSGGSGASYDKVMNPVTKEDYTTRLKVIAAVGQPRYKTTVSISEWENYGKSRTYFKLNMYREGDGKLHHSQDYGYYDNKAQKYVQTHKYKGLSGKLIDASGNNVLSKSDVTSALKKIKK